ncbi:MAG: S8 family serine peptidase, partial [Chloroflexi bacterium]|nr:S8 family serine peptidase [Chloroflexota bacterium]
HIVAPGTQIFSSLPNNTYGIYHGTSMAAPHTVGAIALMLSANPSLTRDQILTQLKNTAVPIAPTHPNFDSGWGRLNAYDAVKSYVNTGTLQGILSGEGIPLPGVMITITNAVGGEFSVLTDHTGQFQVKLLPGSYTILTAPFGFYAHSTPNLVVVAAQVTTQNINLTAVPQGTIYGTVVDEATNMPIVGAEILVEGMPITAVTNAAGHYSITVPEQQAKLTVTANGYRLAHATHLPIDAQSIQQHFSLTPAPAILYVDAGVWGFSPTADYYQGALNALDYAYDTWSVRDPLADSPSFDDLSGYDVVLWADPIYSPGIIDATSAITKYLESGGDLFISGQNIGAYDGSFFSQQAWWSRYLGAVNMGKTTSSQQIAGVENSEFEGLTVTLNGNQSAQNQISVDRSRPAPYSLMTEGTFVYEDGMFAGLHAGACKPYHIVYLGFGLEGINSGSNRQAILQRTFDFFDAPPTVIGSRWDDEDVTDFAVQGDALVYTVTLRNLSETLTDTFT